MNFLVCLYCLVFVIGISTANEESRAENLTEVQAGFKKLEDQGVSFDKFLLQLPKLAKRIAQKMDDKPCAMVLENLDDVIAEEGPKLMGPDGELAGTKVLCTVPRQCVEPGIVSLKDMILTGDPIIGGKNTRKKLGDEFLKTKEMERLFLEFYDGNCGGGTSTQVRSEL